MNNVINIIIKPAYPIFKHLREDANKSDVQSCETFAFARLLQTASWSIAPVFVVTQDASDEPEQFQNVNVISLRGLQTLMESQHLKANFWLMNWLHPTEPTSKEALLFEEQRRFIEAHAENAVTFVYYGIRPHMHPKIDAFVFKSGAKVSIICQANENMTLGKMLCVPVFKVDLHAMPAFYWCRHNFANRTKDAIHAIDESNKPVFDSHFNRYDLSYLANNRLPTVLYPMLHWNDLESNRQANILDLLALSINNDTYAMHCIGDTPTIDAAKVMGVGISELNARCHGVIKCVDVIRYFAHFDATPIIDEADHLTYDCPSFRAIEAIIAGCMPVFKTHDSIIDILFKRHASTYDDACDFAYFMDDYEFDDRRQLQMKQLRHIVKELCDCAAFQLHKFYEANCE